jgi:hypothetical protein
LREYDDDCDDEYGDEYEQRFLCSAQGQQQPYSMASTSAQSSSKPALPLPWSWDSRRHKYFLWSIEENCYIYDTGERLERDGTPRSATDESSDPSMDEIDGKLESHDVSEPSSSNNVDSSLTLAIQMNAKKWKIKERPNPGEFLVECFS